MAHFTKPVVWFLEQLHSILGFPGGSVVKNLPANAGDTGSIPGWEDPLEKEMATHSSILTCRIPWTEEPGGLQSMGPQESDMTERLNHEWRCRGLPWYLSW